MKTGSLLLGTLVSTLALFFLGWLIYGILMENFMAANTNRVAGRPMEEMVMWAILASNLAWGLLLSLINSWTGSLSFTSGAQKGAMAGLLSSFGFNFATYSMSTYFLNLSAVTVDAIVYAVMTCIAGGLSGWVMGRAARKNSAAQTT